MHIEQQQQQKRVVFIDQSYKEHDFLMISAIAAHSYKKNLLNFVLQKNPNSTV